MYTIYTSFRIIITAPREQHGSLHTEKPAANWPNSGTTLRTRVIISIRSSKHQFVPRFFEPDLGLCSSQKISPPPPLKKRTRNPSRKLEKTTPPEVSLCQISAFSSWSCAEKNVAQDAKRIRSQHRVLLLASGINNAASTQLSGNDFFCVVFMFFLVEAPPKSRGTIFFNKSWVRES